KAQKSGRNDRASAAPVVLRQATSVSAPKAAKARWAPRPAPQGSASRWPETATAAIIPTSADRANRVPRRTAAATTTSGQSLVAQSGSRGPPQIGGAAGGAGGPYSGSTGRPQVGQNRAVAGSSPPQRGHDAIPAIVAALLDPAPTRQGSSTSTTMLSGLSARRRHVTPSWSQPSRAKSLFRTGSSSKAF